MNSFLQRSRTLSSRFSSWCLTFSYSRSACWLFLLQDQTQQGLSLSLCVYLNTQQPIGPSVPPVAVDGEQDEEHHGDDDSWDDDGQRDVVLAGVVDGAHHPLTVAELHLQPGSGRVSGFMLCAAQLQ